MLLKEATDVVESKSYLTLLESFTLTSLDLCSLYLTHKHICAHTHLFFSQYKVISLSNWTQCRPQDHIISLILSEMFPLLSFFIPLIGATRGSQKK